MTMTLDTQHQRFGPSAMPFDYSSPSPSSHHPAPTFTNPWTSPSPQPGGDGANPSGHAMYLGSHHHLGPIMTGPTRPLEQQQQQQQRQQQPQPHPQQHQNQHLHHPQPQLPHQQPQSQSHQPLLPQPMPQRSNTASSTSSLASYASSMQVPVTTATGPGTASLMAASYEPPPQQHQDLLPLPHDVLTMARLPPASAAFGDYSTSAPVSASYGSGASYDGLSFAAANTMRSIADDRKSFADALDASHGMLAMSQETPRGNAYGGGVAREVQRDSTDSYGFPNSSGTHSTSSSISSQPGGTFNSYYADSLSEYSTAGSDIESVASRSGMGPSRVSTSSSLMSAVPPPPQTMMGQFSSKLSGSTQKKHKCRVCDKRFTRPSSLQTHMYSHTGEKPFACEVEGCGRHFSVVSNLRRHKKVHRQQHDARSEAGSEDQDQDHDHPSD